MSNEHIGIRQNLVHNPLQSVETREKVLNRTKEQYYFYVKNNFFFVIFAQILEMKKPVWFIVCRIRQKP